MRTILLLVTVFCLTVPDASAQKNANWFGKRNLTILDYHAGLNGRISWVLSAIVKDNTIQLPLKTFLFATLFWR